MYNRENSDFVKSIAKYYMDFLETDFHKRKTPKRKIEITNSRGFKTSIDLVKYPTFKNELTTFLSKEFSEEKIVITKNKYKSDFVENLNVNHLLEEIKNDSEFFSLLFSTLKNDLEYDDEYIIEIEKLVSGRILELLSTLKDIDSKKMIIDSISRQVFNISESIDLSLDDKESIENLRSEVIQIILDVLNNYLKTDFYAEISEIVTNFAVLEKQEIYLYFSTLEFLGQAYPVFYFPVSIVKSNVDNNRAFELTIDSRIFINKKAIEYIIQEFKKLSNNSLKGDLKVIKERIVYISETTNFLAEVNKIFGEIVDYFNLMKEGESFQSRNLEIQKLKLHRNYFISIFDKSDEALVNDYEEILQLLDSDNVISQQFLTLIENFIDKNPKSFVSEINNEWDNKPIQEKLINDNPIPLNSEQLKIISALNKENCDFITVQGPPGTGKSHTISAIVFDYIMKNKSVLVLSDKVEALDVVEDKIDKTLNKARKSEDFQNPILRLGKNQNTYSKILSQNSLKRIDTFYSLTKKDLSRLENRHSQLVNITTKEIDEEIDIYKLISIDDVYNYFAFEEKLDDLFKNLDHTLLKTEDIKTLRKFDKNYRTISSVLKSENLLERLNDLLFLTSEELTVLGSLDTLTATSKNFKKFLSIIKKYESHDELKNSLAYFTDLTSNKVTILNEIVTNYDSKQGILRLFTAKRDVLELNLGILQAFPDYPLSDVNTEIERIREIIQFALDVKTEIYKDFKIDWDFEYLGVLQLLLIRIDYYDTAKLLIQLEESWSEIVNDLESLPISFFEYDEDDLGDLFAKVESLIEKDIEHFADYMSIKSEVENKFLRIPNSKYLSYKEQIEQINALKMTQILDGHLLKFYEDNRNTAKAIKDIISKKQKFPKEKFDQLKDAFPCILASIRDYAEYIPLIPNMFDLVIIDEASQVSIAQAFPALIRSKKVLIMGDKKQFSNVKSNQAKTEINTEFINNMKIDFERSSFFNDSTKLKVDKFNIKNSILDFFEYISNFDASLYKHFRGYKELIAYSNKHFYQNSLQVMKIRGQSIDETIQFVELKELSTKNRINTNIDEINLIISKLENHIKDNNYQSVGIITPHSNQQRMLIDAINKNVNKDLFFENLKLKIMTFDTCQGEERDVIYYSMVANKNEDHLYGVFIKDFSSIDIEEEGKIRAQRLNVGFSRAKEKMVFVLSKPINEFSGEIRNALQFYANTLEESRREFTPEAVDQNSPMERNVLSWFYQTNFWNENKKTAILFPQFELGKYLKQLDESYIHPNYRVDFLLKHQNNDEEYKIIMEYDGFKEHFSQTIGVNRDNYQDYYTQEDIYRQKILESYGYRFIRLNKFNLGNNPIAEIDKRIKELTVESTNELEMSFPNVMEAIDNIKNERLHICKICKQRFPITKIILDTGICETCTSKGKETIPKTRKKTEAIVVDSTQSMLCPNCGSKMVKRSGKYGVFYGCINFPRCYGTRNIKS